MTTLKSAGYTVVGIGMEFSRYQWQNAITENNLPGIQLSEFGGNETETSKAYNVNRLPFMVLIDKSSEIIIQESDFEILKSFIKN